MPYAGEKFLADRNKLVIKQQYDANASLTNMLAVRGTVIELVFTKPVFWFLCSLHYMLWFLKEFHHCKNDAGEEVESTSSCTSAYVVFHEYPLRLGDIDMLSSLVTFFVVFYNGNCFSRYQTMYNNVIAIQGKLHNIGLYLRAYYIQKATRWNVMRYLLASHYIFYWSLKRRYFEWGNSQYKTDPGTFQDLVQDILLKQGMLIKVEAECIAAYKGNKHKLLYAWSTIAMKRIMQAPPPKGEKDNPMLNTEFEQTAVLTNLKEEIVGMRGAIGTIDNSMLFPIPFQYYHIVNVTLWVNLTLVSYALLFVNKDPDPPKIYFLGTVFTLVAYPLIVFVLLGLVEVANAMSDPFGTDACDFNQEAITEGIYNECKSMCEQDAEPFLEQLGNPNFNPSRNPDGTLQEGPQQGPPSGASLEGKEIMWSQADFQAVVDERDKLQEEFERLGVDALRDQIQLDNIPKELQAANYTAVERVGRLEALMSNQMSRLQAQPHPQPAARRRASLVPLSTENVPPPRPPAPLTLGARLLSALMLPLSSRPALLTRAAPSSQPPLPYRRPSVENVLAPQ